MFAKTKPSVSDDTLRDSLFMAVYELCTDSDKKKLIPRELRASTRGLRSKDNLKKCFRNHLDLFFTDSGNVETTTTG